MSLTSPQRATAPSMSPRKARARATSICPISTLLFSSPSSRYASSARPISSSARGMSSVSSARQPIRCVAYASASAFREDLARSPHSWSAATAAVPSPWSTATYPSTQSAFSRASS